MPKPAPPIPAVIALHWVEEDRRLLIKDRGVLVQQRFSIEGWTEDEEPWPDIAAALKRASKMIQVAKWELQLAGIEAEYKQREKDIDCQRTQRVSGQIPG